MPDHPASLIKEDYDTFVGLVDWCDVLFLLVDTREARWFPTVVAAAREKLVVNAAVGFESYMVMRHGLRGQGTGRLGCYFCSDIVSPQNVPPLPPKKSTPSLFLVISLLVVVALVSLCAPACLCFLRTGWLITEHRRRNLRPTMHSHPSRHSPHNLLPSNRTLHNPPPTPPLPHPHPRPPHLRGHRHRHIWRSSPPNPRTHIQLGTNVFDRPKFAILRWMWRQGCS